MKQQKESSQVDTAAHYLAIITINVYQIVYYQDNNKPKWGPDSHVRHAKVSSTGLKVCFPNFGLQCIHAKQMYR